MLFPITDTVGSTTFNPINASLLSVSGSRHFDNSHLGHSIASERDFSSSSSSSSYSSDSDSDPNSDSDSSSLKASSEGRGRGDAEANNNIRGYDSNLPASTPGQRVVIRKKKVPRRPFVVDSSVKLWKFVPEVPEVVGENDNGVGKNTPGAGIGIGAGDETGPSFDDDRGLVGLVPSVPIEEEHVVENVEEAVEIVGVSEEEIVESLVEK